MGIREEQVLAYMIEYIESGEIDTRTEFPRVMVGKFASYISKKGKRGYDSASLYNSLMALQREGKVKCLTSDGVALTASTWELVPGMSSCYYTPSPTSPFVQSATTPSPSFVALSRDADGSSSSSGRQQGLISLIEEQIARLGDIMCKASKVTNEVLLMQRKLESRIMHHNEPPNAVLLHTNCPEFESYFKDHCQWVAMLEEARAGKLKVVLLAMGDSGMKQLSNVLGEELAEDLALSGAIAYPNVVLINPPELMREDLVITSVLMRMSHNLSCHKVLPGDSPQPNIIWVCTSCPHRFDIFLSVVAMQPPGANPLRLKLMADYSTDRYLY